MIRVNCEAEDGMGLFDQELRISISMAIGKEKETHRRDKRCNTTRVSAILHTFNMKSIFCDPKVVPK